MEKHGSDNNNAVDSLGSPDSNQSGDGKEQQEKEPSLPTPPIDPDKAGNVSDIQQEDLEKESEDDEILKGPTEKNDGDETLKGEGPDIEKEKQVPSQSEIRSLSVTERRTELESKKKSDGSNVVENIELDSENSGGTVKNLEEILYEEEEEPVFDGTEDPGMDAGRSFSMQSLDNDSEGQGNAWPEKAVALKNFVREKSMVAVSSVLRRLSGKFDVDLPDVDNNRVHKDNMKEDYYSSGKSESEEYQKYPERSGWNPLSLIGISGDVGLENKDGQGGENIEDIIQPIAMKGRITLYTRLGCQESKETREFLHRRRLRYVEINIDVFPSRKLELEKIAGSSIVPKVFFNEVLIGGLTELKSLEESGKLDEKLEYVITEVPSFEAPLPPLSGEDDLSSSGSVDELAIIVRKMKAYIPLKDRFYKMRRFTNCFLGSEAVDFLSEDQYLEREEAVEFGRKLARELFFHHVLDENIFEDGNHLYRFLDDDPMISECQNIPRGIIEVKPQPIVEISSRLRFLSYAIYEACTSEDRMHVDYRSIHGSEEFARYLRITEELQRVELYDMPREEKLAFFINLYNMMAIHAVLVLGQPSGPLERRRFFGEFKYVIGGSTFSLSAIHNGVLRGNQRPPYNLIKPFGAKDKRLKVALPYPEPLVHFALVCGTRSGPPLQCYSPGNIDKELMENARRFLRNGGLYVDLVSKVALVSKILKWYSVDFGRNEVEVLKHAANYLEPSDSQALLELLSNTQLKVMYQNYDWGLNH